jgi:hypothetical protein
VGPEELERMRAALIDLSRPYPSGVFDGDQPDSVKLTIAKRLLAAHVVIAREALLPEPVDADLIAAREAEAKACEANGFHDYAAETRAGKRDDGPVRHRYEGIKLGRALEKEAGR